MNHELEHSIENLVVELLARLHDSRQGDRGVAILVTSARPEEGKSFVAEAIARYAVTLLGGKVLLVDANPDHPTLHERFSLPLHPGLIDSLGDAAGAKLPIHENVTPGLDVMTAGGVGPTILFLRKEALASLVEACTSRYPLTVIDGSVLQTTGRALLAETAGAVVVVDASATRRQVVSGTLAGLHIGKERILGLVLNRRPQYIPRFLYRFL